MRSTQEAGCPLSAYPSPAPSNFSASPFPSTLPHPRAHPLKAGSGKEAAARRYVEARLLDVSRRYAAKFRGARSGEEEGKAYGEGEEVMRGYVSMGEVCADLGGVVDVLWLSGTPALQVPCLLTIAGSITQYITAFPPAPTATLSLFRKLDHVFVSLLRGHDRVTGEALPGLNSGGALTRTDMIRLRSLVETTRVVVVDLMSGADDDGEESDDEVERDVEGDGNVDIDGESEDERGGGVHMKVARIYAGTIKALGLLLPDGPAFDVGGGQN